MKQYDVYGIGNALVDTEYAVNDALISEAGFDKGIMTLIEAEQRLALIDLLENKHKLKVIHQCGGGSAANSMAAMSQLGGNNFYSCKVATDALGDFFLHDLKAVRLDTNLDSGRLDGVSGQCISMVTPDAERTMTTHLAISNTLSTRELNETALANSRYLYIEGYLVTSPSALQAVRKAQAVAHKNKVLVSLSLSDSTIVEHFKTSFDQLAEQGIDLIFCNQDEAMIWTGSQTAASAFSRLKTICKQAVMTCGAAGALVFDGSRDSKIPGVATKAVDTTGAGDVFAGVFLHSINRGQSFADAAVAANRAASKLVSRFGARLSQAEMQAVHT